MQAEAKTLKMFNHILDVLTINVTFIKVFNPVLNTGVWRSQLFLYKSAGGKVVFDKDVTASVNAIIWSTVLHVMIL